MVHEGQIEAEDLKFLGVFSARSKPDAAAQAKAMFGNRVYVVDTITPPAKTYAAISFNGQFLGFVKAESAGLAKSAARAQFQREDIIIDVLNVGKAMYIVYELMNVQPQAAPQLPVTRPGFPPPVAAPAQPPPVAILPVPVPTPPPPPPAQVVAPAPPARRPYNTVLPAEQDTNARAGEMVWLRANDVSSLNRSIDDAEAQGWIITREFAVARNPDLVVSQALGVQLRQQGRAVDFFMFVRA